MTKRTRRPDRMVALALAVAFWPNAARAGTDTYTAGTGDWSAGGWSPNAPVNGDSVVLPNGGVTVNFDAGANPGTLADLAVDTTDSGIVTLSQSLNTLAFNGTEFIGYTGRGVLTLSGSAVQPTGALIVGRFAGSSGTVTLSDSASLSMPSGEIIGDNGVGVFVQTGGMNKALGLTVGYSNAGSVPASGSFTLTDGSLLVLGGLAPGYEVVGYDTNGSFTQQGGANYVSNLTIGYLDRGNGTYTLQGGILAVTGTFDLVGEFGVGLFNQSGGSHSASQLILGQQRIAHTPLDGVGTYNLSDGQLSVSTLLIVGRQGSGVFTQSGGTAQVATMDVAQFFGSFGTVTLSGGVMSADTIILGGGTSKGGAAQMSVSGTADLTVSNTLLLMNVSSMTQTGGCVSVGAVNIYDSSRYTLGSSGTLTAGSLTIGSNPSLGNLSVQGGTANIQGTAVVATGSLVSFSAGSFSAAVLVNNGTYSQTGGNASVGAISGAGTMSVGGATNQATLATASLVQQSLSIGAGGNVILSTSLSPSLSTLNGLAISAGRFDLSNNGVTVSYAGTNTPLTQIAAWVASARGSNALWAGTGITSSYAAANPGNIGIGYNEAAAVAAYHTNFLGLSLATSATAVLIQPTLYGDITLTGTVNLDDLNIVAANFGKPTTQGWGAGDFLNEGSVTLDDLNLFAVNFGKSLSGFPALTSSQYAAGETILASLGARQTIPEPAALSLAVLVSAALMRRRTISYRFCRQKTDGVRHGQEG